MRILAATILALALSGCASSAKKDGKATTPPPTAATGKAKSSGASATVTEGQLTCKSGSDTRTLHVVKDERGCKTIYNKYGADNEVASGKASGEFCLATLNKIKTNLEGSGFSCN